MVFTLCLSPHLLCLATRAGLGTISRSSDIIRFVQGGVVNTFRWWPRMSNASELISRLSEHCESLAAVRRECDYTDDPRGFRLLDGSLQFFARFYGSETPPTLMFRCDNKRFAELSTRCKSLVKSDRMHWTTEGWEWTDISLEESLEEPEWVELLNDSYRIIHDSLRPEQQFTIDLMRRDLDPSVALGELVKFHELQDVADEIHAMVKPSVIASTTRIEDESDIQFGQSKIGGQPDLPPDIEWPKHRDGRSLAFLAQFNLNEMPSSELKLFPRSGILYFFSVYGWQDDGETDPFIWDNAIDASWTKILFIDNVADLDRVPTPDDVNEFRAAGVSFVPDVSLPTSDREPNWAQYSWPSEKVDRFHDLYYAYFAVVMQRNGNPDENRICGYANYEQEFVSAVAQRNMQLLFQLSADQNAEMSWGDGGFIYFWIEPDDLANRNFSNVVVDSQCG